MAGDQFEKEAKRKRLERETEARITAMIDHYATGAGKDVPLERVAKNLNITPGEAASYLKQAGRDLTAHFRGETKPDPEPEPQS